MKERLPFCSLLPAGDSRLSSELYLGAWHLFGRAWFVQNELEVDCIREEE